MTQTELADYLARAFCNRPLDCMPEYAPPLSGVKTYADMMQIADEILEKAIQLDLVEMLQDPDPQ